MRLCDWFLRKLVTWRSKELRKMMDTCRMRIWGVRVCPLRCVISLFSQVVFSYRLCVFWVRSWRLGGTRAREWRCCDLSCDRWSAYPLASWVFLWCRWRARIGGYPSRSRRIAISSIGLGRCGVAISLSSWIAHSCGGFRGIQASTLGKIPRSITIIPASTFWELPCSCRGRGWNWQAYRFSPNSALLCCGSLGSRRGPSPTRERLICSLSLEFLSPSWSYSSGLNKAFLFRPLRLRSSLNTSTFTCKQILLEFSNLFEVEGIELAGAFDFDDFVLVELGKIEVEFLAEL